jgi:dUTP pyrophosphatase
MVWHDNYYKWFRFLFCMVTMRVKKLREGAVLPKYEHEGDAGMDISACGSFLEVGTNEKKEFDDLDVYVLRPGKRVLVKSGIQVEFPAGYELQIRPRSGLALKKGISLVNSPGTLDAGYSGELGVILINHGENAFEIRKGDRIAQAVLSKFEFAEISEVGDTGENGGTGGGTYLSETMRAEGGFGSSGGHGSL